MRGAETVEAITAAGGRARFVAADLSDPADIRQMVEDAGDIDVQVNNAGFSVFGATADLEVDAFDAMFASNIRAPFFLVAAFAPGMAARGRGSIINVSSMAGQIGLTGAAAYGATKAALSSMTRGPPMPRTKTTLKRGDRIAVRHGAYSPTLRKQRRD